MRFTDFDQIWMLTHGRTTTATEHEVGHLDDWICIALAAKFGWSAIRLDDVSAEYVRTCLSSEPYILNIVCDFMYSPDQDQVNVVVFDHHDPATNDGRCSAHKLMDELVRQDMLREVPPLMEEISRWDVIGPGAVPPENRPDQDKYTALLAAEPDNGFDFKTASFILMMLERSFSIRQLVNELFSSETQLGENARRIHSEILAKREEALEKMLAFHVKESPSGVKYIELDQSPAGMIREIFARKGVDIIIHPNERDKHAFSIVRDSEGRLKEVSVSELVEVAKDKVVFVHPGGFLLVVYPPFDIR